MRVLSTLLYRVHDHFSALSVNAVLAANLLVELK